MPRKPSATGAARPIPAKRIHQRRGVKDDVRAPRAINFKVVILMAATVLLALAALSDLVLSPQSLSREQAAMLVVSATYARPVRSNRESASFETSAGEFFSVACEKVEALCAELRRGKIEQLTVWRVDPGNFGGTWLAAAELGGKVVLSVEEQNRVYRGSLRVMWLLLAVSLVAAAVCATRIRKRA